MKVPGISPSSSLVVSTSPSAPVASSPSGPVTGDGSNGEVSDGEVSDGEVSAGEASDGDPARAGCGVWRPVSPILAVERSEIEDTILLEGEDGVCRDGVRIG